MKYIIYNSDGDILNQVDCPENEIDNYISDELSYMKYSESAVNKIIVDGEVVDKELEPTRTIIESSIELTIAQHRNGLLYESDWSQLPDSPLSDNKKAEWATYRQALRDIPENYPEAISIDDIIWPTKPE